MGKLELDSVAALEAQISALFRQLGNLTCKANLAPALFISEQYNMLGNMNDEFVSCNIRNFGDNFFEQANYMGNQFQRRQVNNSYSNTYSPGW